MTENSTQEAKAVEAVLHDMLAAAGNGDVEGVRRCVSEDLLLYKVGREKGIGALLDAVRSFPDVGDYYCPHLSDMVTRVDGDLATITYRNRSELRFKDGTTKEPIWLESAILQRSDRWRIVFHHSTFIAED